MCKIIRWITGRFGVMDVVVYLKTGVVRMIPRAITYTQGGYFCVELKSGEIHKYPHDGIEEIVEVPSEE